MSVKRFKFVSPGIFVNEIDNSFLPRAGLDVGPVIVGRTRYGPAMRPVRVESFSDFLETFGRPIPGPDLTSGDPWRHPELSSGPTYAAYAARAYLRAGVGPVTMIRLLGTDHDAQTTTGGDAAGLAGWSTGDGPNTTVSSNDGAYGLFMFQSASHTTACTGALAAVWYLTNGHSIEITGTLRGSKNSTGGSKSVSGSAVMVYGGANKEYKVIIKDSGGTAKKTQKFNFDSTSENYIRKVFNTNPVRTNSTVTQTANLEVYWLGETYDSHVTETLGSTADTAQKSYGMILAIESGSVGHHYQKGAFQNAESGYFISQDTSTEFSSYDALDKARAVELFKFVGLDHGSWLQNNIKASIENIKKSPIPDYDPYGSFDVVLRRLEDRDEAIRVIERYTNVNLNPNSPNYIARRIGTQYVQWDDTERRHRIYGDYPNRSKFIRVVMNEDVDNAVTQRSLLPWGVKGPLRYTGFSLLSASLETNGRQVRPLLGGVYRSGLAPVASNDNADSLVAATATIQAVSVTPSQYDAGTLTISDGSTSKTYIFDDDSDGATGTVDGSDNVRIQVNGLSTAGTIAAQIKAAIEHANGHNGTITIAISTADAASDTLTLTQATKGTVGNVTITRAVVTADGVYTISGFSGGGNDNADHNVFVKGHGAIAMPYEGDSGKGSNRPGMDGSSGGENNIAYVGTPGVQLTASVIFPSLRLRLSASDGFLTDAKKAYFGVQTMKSATSTVYDQSVVDHIRPLAAEISSFVPVSSTEETEHSYVFTLDDVITNESTTAYYMSGARQQGHACTSASYDAILDMGYNRFSTVFYGGRDGLDITEMEPFRNTGLSSGNEYTNYAYNTVKRAIDTVADPEFVEMNLLSMPGLTNSSLTSQMIQLCEDRADALAVIDLDGGYVPKTETTNDAVTRRGDIDTVISNLKNRSLNTSYGCTYYPWVRILDSVADRTLWVPPSVVALGTMASSERRSEIWFAPAGFNRGGLTDGSAGLPVVGVAERLTQEDRDDLYESNVNPIAKFPAEGIVIFGQKTLQVQRSALDRINVRRLMIFLKKQISRLSTQVLFDQNVPATWERFKALVNPFLSSVQSRLGITEYRLILDETTTTPDLIDQNVLYAKIFLKPARAIEFIAIDFVVSSTGASFED
jgi:hypothetical protein